MSDDEFDGLPDVFAGLSEADGSRILDQPTPALEDSNNHGSQQPNSPPRAGSTSSTDYGDDAFLDESALADIDRLEAHALQTSREPSSTTRGTGRFFIRWIRVRY